MNKLELAGMEAETMKSELLVQLAHEGDGGVKISPLDSKRRCNI